jgi:hypothetical protein
MAAAAEGEGSELKTSIVVDQNKCSSILFEFNLRWTENRIWYGRLDTFRSRTICDGIFSSSVWNTRTIANSIRVSNLRLGAQQIGLYLSDQAASYVDGAALRGTFNNSTAAGSCCC